MRLKNLAMRRHDRQLGFSLVEMVIVVVIIAIIAAIAIPRISMGAASANEAAAAGNLQLMRDALIRYAAEHKNVFPGPDANTVADQLCQYSDAAGLTAPNRATDKIFGPYLSSIPPCPIGFFPGSSDIAINTDNSPPIPDLNAEAGWVYNPGTGEIIANALNFDGNLFFPVGGATQDAQGAQGAQSG